MSEHSCLGPIADVQLNDEVVHVCRHGAQRHSQFICNNLIAHIVLQQFQNGRVTGRQASAGRRGVEDIYARCGISPVARSCRAFGKYRPPAKISRSAVTASSKLLEVGM